MTTHDNTTHDATYDASSIQVLSSREAVRKRPGMYVGDTTTVAGIHCMLHVLIDNSLQEALAGFADRVEVSLYADGSIEVTDNGRGIPVGKHKQGERSAAEVLMTVLHCGKFDRDAYKKSGGLQGVGVSVVNFLSERLELTIHRDGCTWYQEYLRGEPQGPLSVIGESVQTGTTVRFKPDPEVFAVTEIDAHVVAERLRELSAITGRYTGLVVALVDHRGDEPWAQQFRAPLGLRSWLDELTRERQPLHPPLTIENTRSFRGERVQIELALQWSNTLDPGRLLTFVNTTRTIEGGSHLDGLYEALISVLSERTGLELLREDVEQGLTGLLAVWVKQPRFSGCTRDKLASDSARAVVADVVTRHLNSFLDDHPDEAALGAKLARAVQRRKSNR